MVCRLADAKPFSETNADLLSIEPLGTNFSEILVEENVFEKVVFEIAANLSRPQYVKIVLSKMMNGLSYRRVCMGWEQNWSPGITWALRVWRIYLVKPFARF